MAGNARKLREHKNKMTAKRAGKKAKRALYASLAGKSGKKKARKNIQQFNPGKHKHLMAKCGNPGCRKCGGKYATTQTT